VFSEGQETRGTERFWHDWKSTHRRFKPRGRFERVERGVGKYNKSTKMGRKEDSLKRRSGWKNQDGFTSWGREPFSRSQEKDMIDFKNRRKSEKREAGNNRE